MNIKEMALAIEIPRPKTYCIYFLTNQDGEILYIGQSKKSLLGRIGSHEYDKQFSRVFFIICQSKKEMDETESKLIHKMKPEYNRILNNRENIGVMSITDIKKIIKIDVRIIKRAAIESEVGGTMIGSNEYFDKRIIEAIERYIGKMIKKPLSMDNKVWDCYHKQNVH